MYIYIFIYLYIYIVIYIYISLLAAGCFIALVLTLDTPELHFGCLVTLPLALGFHFGGLGHMLVVFDAFGKARGTP